MSGNDRKAVKAIILLGALLGEGHFGIYHDEVKVFLDNLADLYYPEYGCGTNNEYKELKAEIIQANEDLSKVGSSTIAMMMNSIMDVANDFAIHCKGKRGEVWNAFVSYAENNELRRNLRKNPELMEEIVTKGIEVAEIIYN